MKEKPFGGGSEMLKFIKNLFKTNNENSKRFRRDMAKKIDGKKLK